MGVFPVFLQYLLFLVAVGGSLAAYTPGCSFVGDQCVYSITLGHQKQCDQTGSTGQITGTSSCCDNVTDVVNEMKIQMNFLQKQVDLLQTQAVSATADNKVTISTTAAGSPTSQELRKLQVELNATKEELDLEREKASNEVRDLHERLANVTAHLQLCQLAAGIESSGMDTGPDSENHTALYCSFDADTCGFSFKSIGTSSSIGRKTSYNSYGQGPMYDHSMGVRRGGTMGVDAYSVATSSRSSSSKKGQAISPTFPPSSSYCVIFWYFMQGKSTGQLTVNLLINGGAGYPIFTRSGPQSDQWELAKVDVDFEYTSHSFQVVFEVTTNAYLDSYGYKHYVDSSIAIDDIYVFNTTCNNVPRYPTGSQKAVNNGTTSYYTFHTQPRSWADAYDMCRQQSPWSALVSIDTAEEQQFIVDTIMNDTTLRTIGQSGFYTSGTDVDHEHQFTWTDTGSPRNVPDGFWHTGQPNNVGGNQDCLLLQYSGDGYRWGDIECTSKHPFICEVSM